MILYEKFFFSIWFCMMRGAAIKLLYCCSTHHSSSVGLLKKPGFTLIKTLFFHIRMMRWLCVGEHFYALSLVILNARVFDIHEKKKQKQKFFWKALKGGGGTAELMVVVWVYTGISQAGEIFSQPKRVSMCPEWAGRKCDIAPYFLHHWFNTQKYTHSSSHTPNSPRISQVFFYFQTSVTGAASNQYDWCRVKFKVIL